MPISDVIRKALCDTGGAAGVEFALMAPAMILFAFGIIDVGTMAYEKAEVTAGAHAAAYYAMLNPGASTTSIAAAATAATPLGTSLSATATSEYGCLTGTALVFTTTSPTCTGGTVGTYVQINTQAAYSPLISWGMTFPATLYAQVVVRTA